MEEIRPQFRLDGLEPGREYQLQIYGVNAKGRSNPPVIIDKVRVSPQLGPYGKYLKQNKPNRRRFQFILIGRNGFYVYKT